MLSNKEHHFGFRNDSIPILSAALTITSWKITRFVGQYISGVTSLVMMQLYQGETWDIFTVLSHMCRVKRAFPRKVFAQHFPGIWGWNTFACCASGISPDETEPCLLDHISWIRAAVKDLQLSPWLCLPLALSIIQDKVLLWMDLCIFSSPEHASEQNIWGCARKIDLEVFEKYCEEGSWNTASANNRLAIRRLAQIQNCHSDYLLLFSVGWMDISKFSPACVTQWTFYCPLVFLGWTGLVECCCVPCLCLYCVGF